MLQGPVSAELEGRTPILTANKTLLQHYDSNLAHSQTGTDMIHVEQHQQQQLQLNLDNQQSRGGILLNMSKQRACTLDQELTQ